jgi:hypothetical protein
MNQIHIENTNENKDTINSTFNGDENKNYNLGSFNEA